MIAIHINKLSLKLNLNIIFKRGRTALLKKLSFQVKLFGKIKEG